MFVAIKVYKDPLGFVKMCESRPSSQGNLRNDVDGMYGTLMDEALTRWSFLLDEVYDKERYKAYLKKKTGESSTACENANISATERLHSIEGLIVFLRNAEVPATQSLVSVWLP